MDNERRQEIARRAAEMVQASILAALDEGTKTQEKWSTVPVQVNQYRAARGALLLARDALDRGMADAATARGWIKAALRNLPGLP